MGGDQLRSGIGCTVTFGRLKRMIKSKVQVTKKNNDKTPKVETYKTEQHTSQLKSKTNLDQSKSTFTKRLQSSEDCVLLSNDKNDQKKQLGIPKNQKSTKTSNNTSQMTVSSHGYTSIAHILNRAKSGFNKTHDGKSDNCEKQLTNRKNSCDSKTRLQGRSNVLCHDQKLSEKVKKQSMKTSENAKKFKKIQKKL